MPAFRVHPGVTVKQKGEVSHGFSLFCAVKQDPLFCNATPQSTARGAWNDPCSFCGYAMFESLELNFESGRQQLFFDRNCCLLFHGSSEKIKFSIFNLFLFHGATIPLGANRGNPPS